MFLKKIKLTNFRNFSHVDLEFPQTTLLVGKNAQGKSNLLEAISFLATARSTRTETEQQLIKQGESYCLIEGEIEENSELKEKEEREVTRLEIGMQVKPGLEGLEKRVKVNGVPRRVMDYLGHLVVVYFAPENIFLVAGPPALRRSFMDTALSQVDKQYKRALNSYSATLTARNKLLKRIQEGQAEISELEFWTGELVKWGSMISTKRRELFISLNDQVRRLKLIPGSMGKFRFIYEENVISESRIREYQPREIGACATLIGPHRDDFTFMMDGHNLAFFGSRGEQRTAVLELKLAELHFITEVLGTKPVLLLDDIFSELDMDHRDYVIGVISSQQSIISAVESEPIPEEFLKSVKLVHVQEGKLQDS
ncbi:MAG: replication and repair protein RecF protein [Candidatus Daviesbacteria bacterium GW2011_GWA1_41_61]|uniref:DNA replication and repair protein RecF n=1 Tax=Candidatus Daviesbacteria bacterium GW2011_GWA2_40_9 TaxID=1618424 RepID=A0A0G0WHB6_9BACT|nr:MAG: replication and repair protein recF protein [Candidatus Daviesbacteria bacterium GW2011_GWC1_40_9]KKR83720.1 MAG: replication and repair protein RecF protein [Candidatus Daviesbacteria bacterium GW2011_GWA2_40_9]KKR93685.1 MAG: replication and repair protein RecF protein [Candidatus Daviesbacteria bacterium GW2011_GWB1_41_15]KKS15151.1 MAG: replication and repair protein RecF protein [Candidatus Daviesbacteria bacterium GW2011_GWA1_41_61]